MPLIKIRQPNVKCQAEDLELSLLRTKIKLFKQTEKLILNFSSISNWTFSNHNITTKLSWTLSNNFNHSTGLSRKSMTVKREKLRTLAFLKMERSTKVSGLLKKIKKMEEVSKFGLMVPDTMDSGETVWPMVTADLSTPKVMFTKANGQKTRPMDTVFTLTLTEADMRGNGTRTNSTDSV